MYDEHLFGINVQCDDVAQLDAEQGFAGPCVEVYPLADDPLVEEKPNDLSLLEVPKSTQDVVLVPFQRTAILFHTSVRVHRKRNIATNVIYVIYSAHYSV